MTQVKSINYNRRICKCIKSYLKTKTCLVCSSEQVDKWFDSSTLADGGLVSRYLGKFSQGSHYIDQHFFRLIGQQSDQGLQGFVLLKPSKGGEEDDNINQLYCCCYIKRAMNKK